MHNVHNTRHSNTNVFAISTLLDGTQRMTHVARAKFTLLDLTNIGLWAQDRI